MINEERVKELYKVALYDSKKQQEYQRIRRFYKSDYIGREILKSFFTGTVLFGLFCVIWGMDNWQELMDQINHIDYIGMGTDFGVLYGIFMLLYFVVTWIVYGVRYSREKKEYQKYGDTLKKLDRMYARDDKLKM